MIAVIDNMSMLCITTYAWGPIGPHSVGWRLRNVGLKIRIKVFTDIDRTGGKTAKNGQNGTF